MERGRCLRSQPPRQAHPPGLPPREIEYVDTAVESGDVHRDGRHDSESGFRRC